MDRLNLQNIQGNVLRGYNFPYARYTYYHFTNAKEGRTWIQELLTQVTSAEEWDPKEKPIATLNVGLTFKGLEALQVSSRVLDAFPEEFKQGMYRRAVSFLQDQPQEGPEEEELIPVSWEPQYSRDNIHAVVIIHARNVEELQKKDAALTSITERFPMVDRLFGEDAGLLHQNGENAPSHKEHFGYMDGISQPIIKGQDNWYPKWQPTRHQGRLSPDLAPDSSWQSIQLGEFLLGFQDESGFPSTLPEAPALWDNGTFLVIRKLSQNIFAFRNFLKQAAKDLQYSSKTTNPEEWVAAKIMGRWRSGCPIEQSPDQDDAQLANDRAQNNDFDFSNDETGSKCPLGAHIRRTNPRDSLTIFTTDPVNPDTIVKKDFLSTRHRIIRRGLPYGPWVPPDSQPDGQDRGLMFACFNASIRRQFEFLQEQWINNGEFLGLDKQDRDPVMGTHCPEPKFLVPQAPIPVTHSLKTFVTPKGGGYFFYPSRPALQGLANGAFGSFLQEYESLAAQFADPQKLSETQHALTSHWLIHRAKDLFNELRSRYPVFQVPGNIDSRKPTTIILTKYDDVLEVLSRDDIFSVRLYEQKMLPPRGPFVLGMGNSPQYQRELSILRLTIPREDLTDVLPKIINTIADDLIKQVSSTGRIDIIQDLALAAPRRLNAQYFGVPVEMHNFEVSAPNVEDLNRWTRDIYTDLFLNLQKKPEWTEAADVAVNELNAYLTQIINTTYSRLTANKEIPDTVLSRLLRMQANPQTFLSNDDIRRNIFGVIIGVVETTMKAVPRTLDILLRRPTFLRQAQEAAQQNNDELLSQLVFEAMRFNPQNHVLFRWCEQEYTLRISGCRIPADSLVFAGTLSAMFDPDKIDAPEEFRPGRPPDNYLFFGYGLHRCLGEYISRLQIPALLKRVLRLSNLQRAPADTFNPVDLRPINFFLTFEPEQGGSSSQKS